MSFRGRAAGLRTRRPGSKLLLAAVVAVVALTVARAFEFYSIGGSEVVLLASILLAAWFLGTSYAGGLLSLYSAVLSQFSPSSLIVVIPIGVGLIFLMERLYRIESKLAYSEQQHRNLAELIPFGGWTANSSGQMVSLSDSFLNAFQVTMDECRGDNWLRLVVEEDRQRVHADWEQCVASGYFWDYEYRMQAKTGKRYTVLSRGVPVRGAGERSWVGIHLDVTERELSAGQRLLQAKELARFNAELEQFAYVSSHDLQEPLRMIASYLQLIERRYPERLDEDGKAFIGYAVEGANRLRSLLQDLMLLQQVGKSTRPRIPHSLAEIAAAAAERLDAKVKETGAALRIGALPEFACDEPEMVQLFTNLIDNSLKYKKNDVPPEIVISAQRKSDEWQLRIDDNGIGIDEEFLERIFRIFQRLHPRSEYPGTGIGLAICRKIVEGHGGRIWAESKPGEGSSFVFALPLSSATPSPDSASNS